MTNNVLVDSSFLYELSNAFAPNYADARAFLELSKMRYVIPDVVLTEVAYPLKNRIGQRAVLRFLTGLGRPDFHLEMLHPNDVQRVYEIMLRYADANLDFVDCCLMALAGRPNIPRICTFDRRDFSIYRRPDGSFLELLP